MKYKELSVHERINAKSNALIFYLMPKYSLMKRVTIKDDVRGYYTSQVMILKSEYQSNIH